MLDVSNIWFFAEKDKAGFSMPEFYFQPESIGGHAAGGGCGMLG